MVSSFHRFTLVHTVPEGDRMFHSSENGFSLKLLMEIVLIQVVVKRSSANVCWHEESKAARNHVEKKKGKKREGVASHKASVASWSNSSFSKVSGRGGTEPLIFLRLPPGRQNGKGVRARFPPRFLILSQKRTIRTRTTTATANATARTSNKNKNQEEGEEEEEEQQQQDQQDQDD